MRQRWIWWWVMLASAGAWADDDGERAALTRLVHEIEALEPLIAEAQARSNPDARIKFHYGWLRNDLAKVKLGVREHIEHPRSEPRTFPPLEGDYRR